MPKTYGTRANPTLRDLEILRTLARLRYVTTRELNAVFFGSDRNGRRRLQSLHEVDLIRPHARGLPPRSQYSAWRLTLDGVRLVSEAFPDELLPPRLGERLAAAHLGQIEHREAVSRIYLELVAGEAERPDEDADPAAVRARSTWLRERASQVWWQAEGDVVLPRALDQGPLVPDATICGRHRAVRVFVEVDRATLALGRLATTFDRYRTFLRDGYAATFPDRRAAVLLLVVQSAGRQRAVAELATRHLGDLVPWGVVLEGQTTAFLEEHLLDRTRLPVPQAAAASRVLPREESLRAVAKDMYRWVRAYQEGLRAEGQELPSDGRSLMRRLYAELQPRG